MGNPRNLISNRDGLAALAKPNHPQEITIMKKTHIAAALAALLLASGLAHAGSNVIGSVETNVRVNRLNQSQSGLLNKQKMSIGSVD